MRTSQHNNIAAGLFLVASVCGGQQWVVTRTDADIAADLEGTHVAIALERTSIVGGEPLVLTVTVGNDAQGNKVLCTDAACLGWSIRSTGGATVSARHQPRGGDISMSATSVAPHASRSFTVVAPDAAGITEPGSYVIAVRYAEPGWADRLGVDAEPRTFTVLPRDEAALARQVEKLTDAAASPTSLLSADLAVQALAAIRYPVSEAALCASMARNPIMGAKYLVPRLEASGGAEAVTCLADRLEKPGLDAVVIAPAVARMVKMQDDPVLRLKMENALTDACAKATPDTPWLQAACSK